MFEKHFDYKENKYLFCTLSEKYLKDTALLLNSEWPRSLSQRDSTLRSLLNEDSSRLSLPVSLILIIVESDGSPVDKLIGHLSIVPICANVGGQQSGLAETENLAFIQSVIIDKSFRGKGLGKKMMLLSEDYFLAFGLQQNNQTECVNYSSTSRIKNLEFLFLTTKDQQAFYESLGYVRIEPILCYTVKDDSRCNQIMKNLLKNMSTTTLPSVNSVKASELPENGLQQSNKDKNVPPPPPPPPPPPLVPPPFLSSNANNDTTKNNKTYWYKKCILK